MRNIKSVFLDEFSSVRLAITLFVFLAVTTLIGTILPEEPMVGRNELIKKYGLEQYQFLKNLGLTDVFHSWWYLALLTALGINLTVASFMRVFPKWKIAFALPVPLKEGQIKKLPINCEIHSSGLNSVEAVFKKHHYQTKLTNESLLVAVKGGWHRLGASVTHVGILTLLVGCFVTVLTGFNGMVQLSEKEGFYVADLGQSTTQIRSAEKNNWIAPISRMPIWVGKTPPYLVKVNKTWRESYKTGEPKQWYSDLSILDENKNELKRKVIHVNDPMQFKGFDIYQSNWGKFATVSFNDEVATLPLENFRGEEIVFLPLSDDVGLKLKVSSQNNEPLIKQVAYKPQDDKDVLELYSITVDGSKEKYLGKVNKNDNIQIGPINIGYLGSETMTGLQFKSNPGGLLIYPGLFFLVLGVFMSFGSRKQLWACKLNNESIVIGGTADRARGKFNEEFELMVSKIAKGTT